VNYVSGGSEYIKPFIYSQSRFLFKSSGCVSNMSILRFLARMQLIYRYRCSPAVLNQYSISFKISQLTGWTSVNCYRLSVWPDRHGCQL